MKRIRYALSWIRADFVGLTVCRILGHREPSAEFLAFQRQLIDATGGADEFHRPICARCGSYTSEATA